jgi:predicted dehydrogenase
MTGLQRRFDPNFRRVKEAIEAKEVGETIMVSGDSCFIDHTW